MTDERGPANLSVDDLVEMKLVVIESPYAAADGKVGYLSNVAVELNLHYARRAMRDSIINHGEAPIASHLLYTQPGILDDDNPAERRLGIAIGILWGAHAGRVAFYVDFGYSDGMKAAQDKWETHPTIEIVERRIGS